MQNLIFIMKQAMLCFNVKLVLTKQFTLYLFC